MPAVVFAADRAVRSSHRKIGLVLGAGGVLGAAWMTGALVRLQERLPGPAAEVDLIVGTSAGSVLAAALRCGAPLAEITAWQRGSATGELSESAALAAQDGPLPPLPYPRPGSLPLARAALTLQVPPWVGASGWLPHGRGQHTALRSLVSALHRRHHRHRADRHGADPHPWVDGRTWIAAMDYDTGHRVLFGQPGAPPATLTDAVVASCSIPGWYSPALIGGRRYVDGGIRSATSLGVLRGADVDEVYVLAPMASTEPDRPLRPDLQLERRLRQLITRALVRQAKLLRAEGKHVTIMTPGASDLAVMGANLMDGSRRQAVLEQSLRTSEGALAGTGLQAPAA
ncbi:MAG TPA: patatin-like phospholipase family protein [Streptosporangiaceae bacterium]|nr:patatin-like phospholipase family protein [Streptosporangiaceae bacterium]